MYQRTRYINQFIIKLCLFLLPVILSPSIVTGETISADAVWSGEVLVSEDILVPKGITLTISPGTVVDIVPSEGTRSDPEYLSSLTEITVRGTLKVEGTKKSPVLFRIKRVKEQDRWAGIIIDGGSAQIMSCRIQDAETGIYVINGSLDIEDSTLKENHYGLIAQGKGSDVLIRASRITENDYGILALAGAEVRYKDITVKQNIKKNIHSEKDISSLTLCQPPDRDLTKNNNIRNIEISRQYKDEVLLGDSIWRGRIEINGLIRIPEGARLIIMPGTIVEFRKKDTNGDGIGENGLQLQGVLIAKGTEKNPIIFRSAEKQRKRGDWDSINIMNSDGAQNLIEFSRIEDAYRGLHFHFSNVMVNRSVLKNNYRAIQFQESAVEIRDNYIFDNKSGIKARDSEITFINNFVFDNIDGVNFFRTNLRARDNKVLNNLRDGFKIREGMTIVEENNIGCSRFGLKVNGSFYGRFNRNVITGNYESGLYIKDSDNIEVSGNFIQGNGFNGINIKTTGAVIKGNYISKNGERGIGITSFAGTITTNNIFKNGLYAIEIEGEADVSAPSNWWGSVDISEAIYDKEDEISRGRVDYYPAAEDPVIFHWPLETIHTDVAWYTDIYLDKTISVLSGAILTISPGTKVSFMKNVGLKINGGRILALGEKDRRIVFTSLEKDKDNLWDEVFLEHADGSAFSFSDFEYATWGIHSHFTRLKITGCRFTNNHGGIRFRSGPLEVTGSLFTENKYGIRSFWGNALIEKNTIFKNYIGIFVREGGRGLTIRRNNIHLNTNYNLRVGDFNVEDIDAKENWWGDGDAALTIFDDTEEPGIGRVIYEPFLTEPVKMK